MKIFEKIMRVIRSYIGHLGVYFTLTVLLLNALGGASRTFSPDYFGIAVLFAALLALCDFILDLKMIPSLLARSAIHAVFATLSFTTYDIKADFISFGIGYHIKHKYYLPRHEKKPHRSPVYPR